LFPVVWLDLKPALDLAERLGLRRPNLNLDGTKPRGARRLRWLEVKLQCFFQVRERSFFAFTLAGDIEFETLENV
jgi:hypothetical protein